MEPSNNIFKNAFFFNCVNIEIWLTLQWSPQTLAALVNVSQTDSEHFFLSFLGLVHTEHVFLWNGEKRKVSKRTFF